MMTSIEFPSLYHRPAGLLRAIRAMGLSNLYNFTTFFVRHRRIPNFQHTHFLNDLLFENKRRYEHDILKSFTSDKEFVKIFARGILAHDACVPTLLVLKSEQEIDLCEFPVPCVVKPTHMSQQVIILTAAPTDDERALMKKWFGTNYSDFTLEGNYRRLEPKIIVEPFIKFGKKDLIDFKFYAYRGKVHVIEAAQGLLINKQTEYYTPDWRLSKIKSESSGKNLHDLPTKPKCLDEMLAISEKLAAHFDFLRVDMYSDGGEDFYLGELTHVVGDARKSFYPVHCERYFVQGIPAEAVIK